MADHIAVSDSYYLTATLLRAIRDLADVTGKIDFLKQAMEEMIAASDYTALEQKFGLQAGDGELVYNLTAGALADLKGTNIQQFIARLLQ